MAPTARYIRTSAATRRDCGACFASSRFREWIPELRCPGDAGVDSRGRRAGLLWPLYPYGAVFDNPGLLALCVVGDGESKTGPLAASWHSNKFLNPVRDGAVLPILHLNGYKIANPTVLARIERRRADADCSRVTVTRPVFVEAIRPPGDAPVDGCGAGRSAG